MRISINDLREIVRKELSDNQFFESATPVIVEEVLDEPVLAECDGISIGEQFEIVNEQTVLHEAEQKIEEMKTISEEIRRMKQLVDFRSPLLGKDNF